MMNEVMVREGLAHEYTYDSAYEYQGLYVADEHAADAASARLWSPDAYAGDTEQSAT
ncbi:hypothetical protein HP550_13610 [Cellulomonas humilata]|uniref:TNase-like domain-containing protein n=1 Tax=Cellulomonas humilata TaxID=144055 RepID=A0A7Y6A393_9CELL|nr:thermonuclease family protein [Cellulomonas humilata]NUU18288.1 hypothetical protein [Cellulomonas humilata]